MTSLLGYCTNVHAGATLAQTMANLERYTMRVKRRVSPEEPMGVGLWLSASAAAQLASSPRLLDEERQWWREHDLIPYTMNGFPFGDFHQEVVKHQVYLPTWADAARGEYTRHLMAILDWLLPEGQPATISTLPICWGAGDVAAPLNAAKAHLRQMARELKQLEERTGRHIRLCLEPEPGCALQRASDVVRFFEDYLLPRWDEEPIRRYLGVCHDVCHSAVMFEGQAEAINAYRDAGITIGKVQVSAAVRLPEPTPEAVAQLAGFNEPRYLHQTCVRSSPEAEPIFFEDLGDALNAHPPGEWRTHFHVPIYLEQFGALRTTQSDILECLDLLRDDPGVTFEVETYAWGVLPPQWRVAELSEGIARELEWFRAALA